MAGEGMVEGDAADRMERSDLTAEPEATAATAATAETAGNEAAVAVAPVSVHGASWGKEAAVSALEDCAAN